MGYQPSVSHYLYCNYNLGNKPLSKRVRSLLKSTQAENAVFLLIKGSLL